VLDSKEAGASFTTLPVGLGWQEDEELMNVREGGCLFYGPKMELRDHGPARLRQLLSRCMHMLFLSKKLPSQFLSIVPFASCVLYVARNQSFERRSAPSIFGSGSPPCRDSGRASGSQRASGSHVEQ
jgi:hypothetical protein